MRHALPDFRAGDGRGKATDRMASASRNLLYPAGLLLAFSAIVVASGIAPISRADWLLENVLVLVAVAGLILTSPRFTFTRAADTCIFVFLALHEIGAHYTYSLVPYEEWMASTHGITLRGLLGWERNAYDRMIHLAYGLLILLPITELMRVAAPPRGWWRFVQAPALILAGSALYELIEFAAALTFGGELGEAYLGTQGDVWDAEKDMACALAGALVAQLVLVTGRARSIA